MSRVDWSRNRYEGGGGGGELISIYFDFKKYRMYTCLLIFWIPTPDSEQHRFPSVIESKTLILCEYLLILILTQGVMSKLSEFFFPTDICHYQLILSIKLT